jgi:hypothetical protein
MMETNAAITTTSSGTALAAPESIELVDTISTPSPKKVRDVDDRLIQYKESAFLSDMLSSSKD